MEYALTKPKWNIQGQCNKCGKCCKLLAISLPNFWNKFKFIRNHIRWYYEINYNFKYVKTEMNTWLIFTCKNLNENNLCSIYPKRPRICREYPSPYARDKPDIPPDCGFKLIEP